MEAFAVLFLAVALFASAAINMPTINIVILRGFCTHGFVNCNVIMISCSEKLMWPSHFLNFRFECLWVSLLNVFP